MRPPHSLAFAMMASLSIGLMVNGSKILIYLSRYYYNRYQQGRKLISQTKIDSGICTKKIASSLESFTWCWLHAPLSTSFRPSKPDPKWFRPRWQGRNQIRTWPQFWPCQSRRFEEIRKFSFKTLITNLLLNSKDKIDVISWFTSKTSSLS